MLRKTVIISLAAAVAVAVGSPAPAARAGVDNTKPYGRNPIQVSSAQYLGRQTSANSCSSRDLGFTGRIHDDWYGVYGDTLWCSAGARDWNESAPGFHGMVRDSIGKMTADPLRPLDVFVNGDAPVAHARQFVPFDARWGENESFGFGGTSICQTSYDESEAAVFYLVNSNTTGLVGAGVARINVIDGTPTVVQRYGASGYWWSAATGPRYGDVAAYSDLWSEYIYGYGGAAASIVTGTAPGGYGDGGADSNYVFMTRVPKADAFDVSKYEYWRGRAERWSRTPLAVFSPETAVLWDVGQGQVVWNAFYGLYVFVHMTPGGTQLGLKTAPSPEGPWSDSVFAYTATVAAPDGCVYAAVAHPYLDESGRTLTVSYTNYPDIEVVVLTFA